MRKVPIAALTGIVLLAACGDDGSPGRLPSRSSSSVSAARRVSTAYGWSRPVTAKAIPDAGERPGDAKASIQGHSLRAIVTDARVRVRADDRACVSCHEWAKDISRDAFCDRVPAFLEQPTAKDDKEDDDEAAKPILLKDLLDRWREAGCPE